MDGKISKIITFWFPENSYGQTKNCIEKPGQNEDGAEGNYYTQNTTRKTKN